MLPVEAWVAGCLQQLIVHPRLVVWPVWVGLSVRSASQPLLLLLGPAAGVLHEVAAAVLLRLLS